ncbi:coiled-coil domain-containing protein [Niallia endozanthoxylica]|uniref:Uncharacterized protein n=1 Tax=Niallia endozanthoxylica TaxID=2036016 RepID=A0A5J5H598_9BACI|nr:hypothetical protein [Niallia endozanthoxylica]KAA9014893.1 hypothetical protein F4V44_23110 [Niallia endozanthoxylica]
MEELDMKEILIREFENDPIYRLALLNKLEDSIFTESILALHKDTTYSTVETGKIIDRADSTIRNHFRSELVDYIAPEKYGKFYRLNYKSVFKLHLIFLLMDKAGKTTIDFLSELGLEPGVTVSSNIKRLAPHNERNDLQSRDTGQDNVLIETRIQEFEKKIDLQNTMINILKYEKDISDLESKITHNQSKINEILILSRMQYEKELSEVEQKITHNQSKINKILMRSLMEYEKELSEVEQEITNTQSKISEAQNQSRMKYLEDKQTLLIANSLKSSFKKSSLFGFLKKSEVNVHQLANEINSDLKTKYENEAQENINEFKSIIKDLQSKKLTIEGKVEPIKNQLHSFSFYNDLLDELDVKIQDEIKEYITNIKEFQIRKEAIESKLDVIIDQIYSSSININLIDVLEINVQEKIKKYLATNEELENKKQILQSSLEKESNKLNLSQLLDRKIAMLSGIEE